MLIPRKYWVSLWSLVKKYWSLVVVVMDLENFTLKAAPTVRPGNAPKASGRRTKPSAELKILADVGLLGLPNAGKSSLLQAISAATPKVADYPFTTLHPSLGVVSVAAYQSFMVADFQALLKGRLRERG